jgi:alpha-glucosidase
VVALARRSGDCWFLAVMNGPVARTLKLRLSFLPAGAWQALLVRDHAGQSDDLEVENATVSRGDLLKLSLEPGGGFIGRYSRP